VASGVNVDRRVSEIPMARPGSVRAVCRVLLGAAGVVGGDCWQVVVKRPVIDQASRELIRAGRNPAGRGFNSARQELVDGVKNLWKI